jgi:AraC-like DNA-binding protein
MNNLLEKIFFSISFLSVLVFFDVLVKFKRPLLLKYNFALITFCIGAASYIHSIDLFTNKYVFYIILSKAIVSSSFLNIFSILYFPNYRKWVLTISIILISFTVYSFYYNELYNPDYINSLKSQTLVVVRSENLQLPLALKAFRVILILSFFITFFTFLYKIINKFGMNNIYFDKIKAWTISIFILIVLMLLMYLPIPYLRDNFYNGYFVSALFYIYILFIILYRPAFLNKSSMKISLGDSFSKNADFIINDLDFITNFFTHFYFTNPDASLENFAKVLNVGSNDLYKFVYYKYNMTFNDLVNKHRVEYFIDIIHNPKFLNYTIDALAKEAGFSSRQHLYKPFKKFHGGNPSDLIDSIAQ